MWYTKYSIRKDKKKKEVSCYRQITILIGGTMARKVTTEDIKQFNELYCKYKSYAEVARQTGWSASTVSKYIDKNYKPVDTTQIIKFDLKKDMPEFSTDLFDGVENFGDLCILTDEEEEEIKKLWEEMVV